jgi:hypothetical protein
MNIPHPRLPKSLARKLKSGGRTDPSGSLRENLTGLAYLAIVFSTMRALQFSSCFPARIAITVNRFARSLDFINETAAFDKTPLTR